MMRLDEISAKQKSTLINSVIAEYLSKIGKNKKPSMKSFTDFVKSLCADSSSDLHKSIVKDVVNTWIKKNPKLHSSKVLPKDVEVQGLITQMASNQRSAFYQFSFNDPKTGKKFTVKPYQYINAQECLKLLKNMYSSGGSGSTTSTSTVMDADTAKRELDRVKYLILNKMTFDQVKKLKMYLGRGEKINVTGSRRTP